MLLCFAILLLVYCSYVLFAPRALHLDVFCETAVSSENPMMI